MQKILFFTFFNLISFAFFWGSESLEKAEDCYFAALFEEAIPLYKQAWPLEGEARAHYADALIRSQEAPAAISFLESLIERSPEETFFLGSAYAKEGVHDKAADVFARLLDTKWNGQPDPLKVRYQLALALHESGRVDSAKGHLTVLVASSSNPLIRHLAMLTLARIALDEGDASEASRQLETLERILAKDDLLFYEVAFLQGKAALLKRNWRAAILAFEQAIPQRNVHLADWYPDTLYHLGCCTLKVAQNETDILKAEALLDKLIHIQPNERAALALGQCYLVKAALLDDIASYQAAERLLSDSTRFQSIEGKAQALLLRSQAAPTYAERADLYRLLTQEENAQNIDYAKSWYLRGMNDYDERMWEAAAAALGQAYELLVMNDKPLAGKARLFQAQALAQIGTTALRQDALGLLNHLVRNPLMQQMESPDEVYYLRSLIALQVGEHELAIKSLCDGLQKYPEGDFSGTSYLLLGKEYFLIQDYRQAEDTFQRLVNARPESSEAGEAWFWMAQCADKENALAKKQERLHQVFEQYPHHPIAGEAYFTLYTYRDYLQGDRQAIKHLQSIDKHFPHSPYSIAAHYLIGLDAKRDRKTVEGKWISRKNWLDAIAAFHEAEARFESLKAQNLLLEKADYWKQVRDQAVLERAMANLAVAEDSQGAKRQIYLEYAEDVFKHLVEEQESADNLSDFQQECLFGLSQVYLKGNHPEKAILILQKLTDPEKVLGKSYFTSRSWYELGFLALKEQTFEEALGHFIKAEETGQDLLKTDQKLDLWIQQSHSYRGMKQNEQAILTLSKVVNDDAVSGLRLKAMYLRADIYAGQGRHDLARKQLESTAKKGGEWGQQAKERLEKDYGYK